MYSMSFLLLSTITNFTEKGYGGYGGGYGGYGGGYGGYGGGYGGYSGGYGGGYGYGKGYYGDESKKTKEDPSFNSYSKFHYFLK